MKQQQSAAGNERPRLCTHTCRNTFTIRTPHIILFIRMLKEYQNMIYIKLRSVNLSAAVANKRSHVAVDLIRKYEVGKISGLEFVSKISYRQKKNGM